MIITGMKYVLEDFGILPEEVFAAFSFYNKNLINNYVYPDSWATNSTTGILNKNDNFYTYSGSGYFDGSTYMSFSGKAFSLDNSLILLSYEKQRFGNEILLTSLTGNSFNSYSGFVLGVNDANKLYLSYWNNIEGYFTFTYDNILSDKNLIIINKNGPVVSIGKYNNNTFEFETQDFNIYQNVFIDSHNLYLGGSPFRNQLNENYLNFSGIIDKFFIIKNSDLYFSQKKLASGIYSNINNFDNFYEKICFETGFFSGSGYLYSGVLETYLSGYEIITTGVTGYENISSGNTYYTLTGYETISLGFYVDNCGKTEQLFYNNPLSGFVTDYITVQKELTGIIKNSGYSEITNSGLLSGTEYVWLTGLRCVEYGNNFLTNENLIDSGYLASLSYKQINLLKQVLTTGFLEIYSESYKGNTLKYNKDLLYDSLNKNYFYLGDTIQNKPILFANGQLLIESGYEIIQEGYSQNIDPKLDFYLTGNLIETAAYYEAQDYLFYDDISGKENIFTLSNYLSGTKLLISGTQNDFIYRNGQKLIKDIDYNIFTGNNSNVTGLSLKFNIGENSEIFMIKTLEKIYNQNLIINTGYINLLNDFNHGCSMVYLNGVRQKINNNYIENAYFDLISGNFYENINFKNIYNNTDNFLTIV